MEKIRYQLKYGVFLILMPISKIIFKPRVFDKIFGSGIYRLKCLPTWYMDVQTFAIPGYRKVSEKSLTAELVNWLRREFQSLYVRWF